LDVEMEGASQIENPLLAVEALAVHFGPQADPVRAVDGVSFTVARRESVALVGESGSGKSISALALTRLLPKAARIMGGKILFEGADLLSAPLAALRRIRGNRIAYIFQEPSEALNPVFTIGRQVEESLRLHRRRGEAGYAGEVARLLDRVQLPQRAARAYPHELSGGQQQRAMIAMALACGPDLLVADEPTTALDVTVQREILRLLAELRNECGLAVLLITHNFGLVAGIADRIYVMKQGRVVESGPTLAVLRNPQDAYTRHLMAAIPRLHPSAEAS